MHTDHCLLVQDEAGHVVLVGKQGKAFMQPGGKLQDSESYLDALERKLRKERVCSGQACTIPNYLTCRLPGNFDSCAAV